MSSNRYNKRRTVFIFAVICCGTFLLNYTVIKNLDEMGFLKKSTTLATAANYIARAKAKINSDAMTVKILNYRQSRSVDNLFFSFSLQDSNSNDNGINMEGGNSSSTVYSMTSDGDVVDSDNNEINMSNTKNNIESIASTASPATSTCYFPLLQNPLGKSKRKYSGAEKSAHAKFTFLPNYIVASMNFECNETITYTSHGDFRYLDNLVPLVERWEGPISLALYTPGTDFEETETRIQYLRECTSPLVKQLVTFHIFYDNRFAKDTTTAPPSQAPKLAVNCSVIPDFGEDLPSFRKDKGLSYPVNVARNLARRQAKTHFILASDIELYPSVNIIPQFLELIAREQVANLLKVQNSDSSPLHPIIKPRVYVLPIFEVEETEEIPNTKADLITLLKKKTAVPFHKYVCPECHKVPKYMNWIKKIPPADQPPSLNVFHVAKRKGPYHFWEPIYLGTNQEPFYDERLSWEGLRDKMSQGFILCIMDYDFMILDNAFLVHRPGIKKKRRSKKTTMAIRKQNRLLGSSIMKEITKTYGKRPGCYL